MQFCLIKSFQLQASLDILNNMNFTNTIYWGMQRPHWWRRRNLTWKRSFISLVWPTVHTNPLWKRSLSKANDTRFNMVHLLLTNKSWTLLRQLVERNKAMLYFLSTTFNNFQHVERHISTFNITWYTVQHLFRNSSCNICSLTNVEPCIIRLKLSSNLTEEFKNADACFFVFVS